MVIQNKHLINYRSSAIILKKTLVL